MIRAESSCRNRWVREGKELTPADMEVDATNDPLLAVGFADAGPLRAASSLDPEGAARLRDRRKGGALNRFRGKLGVSQRHRERPPRPVPTGSACKCRSRKRWAPTRCVRGTSMMVEESSTHEVTNPMSPPATSPPVIIGRVILAKVCRRLAPRLCADSSRLI